jgi:hypothetical protein
MVDTPKKPSMNVQMVSVDKLVPDPDNPRVNNSAVSVVAESIRLFGFRVPLVVNSEYKISAGHTRYRAALMLGIEEVPCLIADDLTPDQLAAFSVAENRTSDFSFFDVAKLGQFVTEIPPELLASFELDTLLTGSTSDGSEVAQVVTEPTKRAGLDLAPFEKYQYVMIMCRTEFDYTNLLTMLHLENVQKGYITGVLKAGASYGRVIEYPDFMDKVVRRES